MKNKRKKNEVHAGNQVRGEVNDNLLSMEYSNVTCSYTVQAQLAHMAATASCHDNLIEEVKVSCHDNMIGKVKVTTLNNYTGHKDDDEFEKKCSGELKEPGPWQQIDDHIQDQLDKDGVDSVSNTENVYISYKEERKVRDDKFTKESMFNQSKSLPYICKSIKETRNEKKKEMTYQSLIMLKSDQHGVSSNKLQKMKELGKLKKKEMEMKGKCEKSKDRSKKYENGIDKYEKCENDKDKSEKDITKEDFLREEVTVDNKEIGDLDDDKAKYEKVMGYLPIRRNSAAYIKEEEKEEEDVYRFLKQCGKERSDDDETGELDNKDVEEQDNRSVSSTGDEETSCKSELDPLRDNLYHGSHLQIHLPEKGAIEIAVPEEYIQVHREVEENIQVHREIEEDEHFRSGTENSWIEVTKSCRTDSLNSIPDGIMTSDCTIDEETTPLMSVCREEHVNCSEEELSVPGNDDISPNKAFYDEILSEKERARSEWSEKDELMEVEVEINSKQIIEIDLNEVAENGKDTGEVHDENEKRSEEKELAERLEAYIATLAKFCCKSILDKMDLQHDCANVTNNEDVEDRTKDERKDGKEAYGLDKEKEITEGLAEKLDKLMKEIKHFKMASEQELDKYTKEMEENEKGCKIWTEVKPVVKKVRGRKRKKNKMNSVDCKQVKKTEIEEILNDGSEGIEGCRKRVVESPQHNTSKCIPLTQNPKAPGHGVSAKSKSKMPKSRRHCKPKSKTSDCDMYIPKTMGCGRRLKMFVNGTLRGRQCSDSGSNHSGSSNGGDNSHDGSKRRGNSDEDANNNYPDKDNKRENEGNPNDGDGPGRDGPPPGSMANKRPRSSLVDVTRPEQDFKRYRKKHSDISVEHWEKFLGYLKELAERPCMDLNPNPVDSCLELCMEKMEDLPDDMLECVVCSTINSLLKHYANCNSLYIACDLCTQIFSLITCHVNVCSRQVKFVMNSNNCNIALCKKICVTLTGNNIGDHLKTLWFNVRKKLSRVMDVTETGVTPERKSSVISMPSIPEHEVPPVTQGSRPVSRILSRKRSNLIPVEEGSEESLGASSRGEMAPGVHGEVSDNSVDAVPEPGDAPVRRDRFSSLPMGPPKGFEYQFPSFTDRPVGVKGIGEVVYGDKTQLSLVVQYWDKLKKDYTENGKLLVHYREEGVILNKYKDMLTIGTMRYQKDFQWVRVSPLGNGMSGKCSLATDFQTDAKFCVKEIHISSYEMDEISLIMDLDHPYIVQLYGAIRFGERVFIFMEYIAGGCLTEAINHQKELGQRLSQATALRYFQQLLQVLCYLKSKRILQEDLKGDNILLHKSGKNVSIKVTDFGSARRCQGQVRKGTPPVGTQTQWSPEKAEATGYSFPAEVWAGTCVLVHMLSGTPPWIRRFGSVKTLIVVIVDNSPPLEDIPKNISKSIIDLIERGFTVCQGTRPTAEQLLLHPAFRILDDSPNTENYSILGPGFHSVACIEDDISQDLREIYRNLDKNNSNILPTQQPIQVYTLANQSGASGGADHPGGGASNAVGGASNVVGGATNSEGGASNSVGGANGQSGVVRLPSREGHTQLYKSDTAKAMSELPLPPCDPVKNIDFTEHFWNYLTDTTPPGIPDTPVDSVVEYNPDLPTPHTNTHDYQMSSISSDEALIQNRLPHFNMLVPPDKGTDSDDAGDDEDEEDDLFKNFDLNNALKDLNLGPKVEGPPTVKPGDSNLGSKVEGPPTLKPGEFEGTRNQGDSGLSVSVTSTLQTRPINHELHDAPTNSFNESINDDDLFKSGSPKSSRTFDFEVKTNPMKVTPLLIEDVNLPSSKQETEAQAPRNPPNFPYGIQHNQITQMNTLPNQRYPSSHVGHHNTVEYGLPYGNRNSHFGKDRVGDHRPQHELQPPDIGHGSSHHIHHGVDNVAYHGPHHGHFGPAHQAIQVGHPTSQYGHPGSSHGQVGVYNYGHPISHSDHQTSHVGHQSLYTHVPSTSTTPGMHGASTYTPYSLHTGHISTEQQIGLQHTGGEPSSMNPNQMSERQHAHQLSLSPNHQYVYHPRYDQGGSPQHGQQNEAHSHQHQAYLHHERPAQRPVYSQQPHSYAGYQTPGQFGVEGNDAPRQRTRTPSTAPSMLNQQRTTGAMFDTQRTTDAMYDPQRTTCTIIDPQRATGAMFDPKRTTGTMFAPQKTTGTMLDPQRAPSSYFPGGQRMQYSPNARSQYVPHEMIVTSPPGKQAVKQQHLQLDVEKAKYGPSTVPSTYAQTAPVFSPPKTPKLTSPPFKRTVSYVPPKHTRLSASSNSAGSRSTPKSQFEEQERALLELGDTAKKALSQHEGSFTYLEEDEDQAFDVPGDIDLEGDLTAHEWASMAPYLEDNDGGSMSDTRIEVTFKKRGQTDGETDGETVVLKMGFPKRSRRLTWESIIDDELSLHEISAGFDRFCLRLENGSLIDLDSCLGEEDVVVYMEPADDSDWWWVERGVIMKSNQR